MNDIRRLKGKLTTPRYIFMEGDYEEQKNHPSINGVELLGDKTFEELGEGTITNSEIQAIIDTQYAAIFGGN